MGGDPGQFGYILTRMVTMVLLSFLDAQARCNRERKRPGEEDESDWAYLRRVVVEDEIEQGVETG